MIIKAVSFKKEIGLGIEEIPYRKSKALVAHRVDKKGVRTYPLAYFMSDDAAKEAEHILRLLTGVSEKEESND